MRFVLKELFRSSITHWKYNALILCDLALCVIVVFILMANMAISSESAQAYKERISDKVRFSLNIRDANFLDEVVDGTYPAGDIKKAINDHPAFSAYSLYSVGMFLESQDDGTYILPDIFAFDYETSGTAEETSSENGMTSIRQLKMQCFDETVFDEFDISMSEGRPFSVEEYTSCDKTKPLPVILGAEYKEYFHLGDTIPISSGFGTEQVIIIGFMEKNTLFVSSDRLEAYTLDRYIIAPECSSLIEKDGSVTDISNQKDAMFVINGTLVVNDASVNVQDKIDKITNIYGFPSLLATQWSGLAIQSGAVISQRNVFLYSGLAIVICGLSVLSITTILRRKLLIAMPVYGTYMISGISLRLILVEMIAELILFAGFSVIPSIWVSYLQFGFMIVPIWKLLLVGMPILLISFLPAAQLMSKMNLDLMIRRKSQ
jgi:hypothetical protein